MEPVLPRHVLCFLGKWDSFDALHEIVSRYPGFTLEENYSQLTADPRMPSAFAVCFAAIPPTDTPRDHEAVGSHSAVAYVLSPPLQRGCEEDVSGQALELTGACLGEVAIAAKSESAGVAHGREHWMKLAAEHSKAKSEDVSFAVGSALFHAWVKCCIQDSGEKMLYTCGMHLLGYPDIEVAASPAQAHAWQSLCGLHMVADKPDPAMSDGDGFRLSAEGERRIVRHVPFERYEEDDFFFNPFGYFRLEPIS